MILIFLRPLIALFLERFYGVSLTKNDQELEILIRSRPHQGLGQDFPISCPSSNKEGLIRRRDVLGGIIHDYSSQPSTPVSGYR